MAYGVQKYAEFKDDFGQDWKIEILKEGYGGATSQFTLSSTGFQLKYTGEGDDLNTPIKGSEVTFTFYTQSASDDTFIIDIANADQTDYAVRIYKDTAGANTIYWVGNIVMDSAEILDAYFPQPHMIRAIDGIANLQNFIMTDLTDLLNVDGGGTENFNAMTPGGPVWTGSKYNFLVLLARSLALMPTTSLWGASDTFLKTIYDWTEDRHPTSGNTDPLYWTAIFSDVVYSLNNDDTYNYWSIHSLVKEILNAFNARLFMADGVWNIVQVSTYKFMPTAAQKFSNYKKSGVYISTGTTANFVGEITDASSPFKPSQLMNRYTPPIKKIMTKSEAVTAFGGEADNETWSSSQTTTLDADQTPIAAQYTNTFTASQVADNGTTFTLNLDLVLTSNLGSAWNYPSYLGQSLIYYLHLNFVVKCGSKYLYYDTASTKWKWDSSFRPCWSDAETPYSEIPFDLISEGINVYIGGWNLDMMEQMPNTDPIEFYGYYRMFSSVYGDLTSEFDAADHTVKIQNNSSWGVTSVGCSLFFNGSSSAAEGITTIVNAPGGTPVSGGITIEDTIAWGGTIATSTVNLLSGDGSGFSYPSDWRGGQLWNNTNSTGLSDVDIIAMRGIDWLAMQSVGNKVIQGDILRTSLNSTTDVIDFSRAIVYDGDVYVPNGLTFNAREGRTSGEWQRIQYDVTVAQSSSDIIELVGDSLWTDWMGNSTFSWSFW